MEEKRTDSVCLDTNVLLRFLLEDDSVLYIQAKKVFKEAERGQLLIYLDEVILAEAIWVLLSVYKLEKQVICQIMTKLLVCKWLVNPRKELMLKSIGLWAKTKLHYPDCWLFILSGSLGFGMKTFDLDLMRMAREK